MPNDKLAKIIDDAFEGRDKIGPKTKGAVRKAVEIRARPARPRRGARRRAPGRRRLAGQSMAQKGGAAVVPAQRHERDHRRPRQGRRGGTRCRRNSTAGPRRNSRRPASAPCRARRAPLRLHRARRGADAVLRQSRRLCRRRHHDRHLVDGRLVRADRQELPYLGRRRHRRRARAVAGRARRSSRTIASSARARRSPKA